MLDTFLHNFLAVWRQAHILRDIYVSAILLIDLYHIYHQVLHHLTYKGVSRGMIVGSAGSTHALYSHCFAAQLLHRWSNLLGSLRACIVVYSNIAALSGKLLAYESTESTEWVRPISISISYWYCKLRTEILRWPERYGLSTNKAF